MEKLKYFDNLEDYDSVNKNKSVIDDIVKKDNNNNNAQIKSKNNAQAQET